jgi:hypothetical protein
VEPEIGPRGKPTGNYLVNAGEGRRVSAPRSTSLAISLAASLTSTTSDTAFLLGGIR